MGGRGFDQLLGGEGNDVMDGGGSTGLGDRLFGEDGNDRLTVGENGWALGGAGNDTIHGGAGAWLTGDAGNDIIVGGAGMQQIVGGADNDTLTGGADYDRFDFGAKWGHDTVTDFNVHEDKIYLASDTGVDSFSQLKITDTTDGALISFHDDTILLRGVFAISLGADQFAF